MWSKPEQVPLRRDEVGGNLFYWLIGHRHPGGKNVVLASMRNVGRCRGDVKGVQQVGNTHRLLSTNAPHAGGSARSSVEGAVIASERRGRLGWSHLLDNRKARGSGEVGRSCAYWHGRPRRAV